MGVVATRLRGGHVLVNVAVSVVVANRAFA